MRGDRRGHVISTVLLTVALVMSAPAVAQEQAHATSRFTAESTHMGTTFRIVTWARDKGHADRATRAAFEQVARLDSLFSDYRDDSEIASLARTAGDGTMAQVSDELWRLLSEGRSWSERTSGAFDVTVGPLSRLWRWSARRGELPDPERLASARAAVDYRSLLLDPAERSVGLSRPGMSLDLGGIAKGFAADAALAVLADHGLESALVDAGGDLAIGAAPPGERGWTVALSDGETLTIEHAAIATSGDTYRNVVIDGIRYAHIVDPHTGVGVVDAPVVTVVGPDATTADALASALSVLDVESGRALVGTVEGVWARVTGEASWSAGAGPPTVATQFNTTQFNTTQSSRRP